jgi:outer membrane protein OmpA-like peptidoglycan-associated protein
LRISPENRPVETLADDRRGFVLEEYTIYFGPDESILYAEEREKLTQLVEMLASYPESRFIISGHTALAGTEPGRELVSRERVQVVADFLIAEGIESSRLETSWYGARLPAAPNDEEGRPRNRRVELIILEE